MAGRTALNDPRGRAVTAGSPPGAVGLPERLVLVGFMGAGKSTVGRLVADRLGWSFIDLDGEIERREARPVHEIIRNEGLNHFRRIETVAGREAIRGKRVVVAVGGGWPAEPGNMDLLEEGTFCVWLQVSPRAALARLAKSDTPRPLLEVADPVAAAEELLSRRRSHYGRGSIRIDTDDLTPDEVVRDILERLIPCSGDKGKEETA